MAKVRKGKKREEPREARKWEPADVASEVLKIVRRQTPTNLHAMVELDASFVVLRLDLTVDLPLIADDCSREFEVSVSERSLVNGTVSTLIELVKTALEEEGRLIK